MRQVLVASALTAMVTSVVTTLGVLAVVRPTGVEAAPDLQSGGAAQTLVRARAFELVGPTGALRGQWSVTEGGAARMILGDSQERPRVSVAASDEVVTVTLMDGAGEQRAGFGVRPNVSTAFARLASGPGAGFYVDSVGGEVSVVGGTGQPIWRAP